MIQYLAAPDRKLDKSSGAIPSAPLTLVQSTPKAKSWGQHVRLSPRCERPKGGGDIRVRVRMEGTTPNELSLHEIKPTATMLRRWGLSLWGSTVIMVRHADIVNAGSDPGLSSVGVVRANPLAHMLQDAALSAVFVTQFLRPVETGSPAAVAAGLAVTPYMATDTAGLVMMIRTSHANKTVLVVAHSNTVDDIAAGLGVPSVGELAATQFDRMFVITRTWCGTRVCRMRYGASTP